MVTRWPSSSRGLLLRLSGARLDVLDRTPGDRARFYGVGVSVLTSACMAAVSMAFAVHLAFRANLWLTFAPAIAWGLAVLRLNYWMVASLPQLKSLRPLFLTALPRILIAVFVAAIISIPFVLQIFSPEITAEIPIIQHQQLNAFLAQQKASPLQKKISNDQAVVDALRTTIAMGKVVNPYQNPNVQILQSQLEEVKADARIAQTEYNCALYGGSGCPSISLGFGPIAQAARARYQADAAQIANLQNQIAAATAQLINSNKTLEAAIAALPGAQETSKADEQQQTTALANFNRNNASTGLLIQLKALSALSSGNSALRWAQYLLFLLFVAIDSLPVTTRVLIQLGPETSYDKVLAMENSMTLRVNEDVVAQREARLLQEAEKTIEEASARFAAEAADHLREHPEEIADGPTSLYRSLLSGESEHGRPGAAKHSGKRSHPSSGTATAGLASFTEHEVEHSDGRLWRLECGDQDFLLVDSLDGIPTLNWTAAIGVREFALLVSERIELGDRGEPSGTLLISVDGAADEVDARLGVRLTSLATASLDRRCEFIRFDDHQAGMALQVLPGADDAGKLVRMFGISSAQLSMDSVISLISRTATGEIKAHALEASTSPLIARLRTLAERQTSKDTAVRREL